MSSWVRINKCVGMAWQPVGSVWDSQRMRHLRISFLENVEGLLRIVLSVVVVSELMKLIAMGLKELKVKAY